MGLTSTGYTSPSWLLKAFMWVSGNRPLGKRDRRTNSGSVRSSSRERVKRVPLDGYQYGRCVVVAVQGIPQVQRDILVCSNV